MKDKEDLNEYIIVFDKYIDQILQICHKLKGHKGYKYLVDNRIFFLIIYIKNVIFLLKIVLYVKTKKNIFKKPSIIQIRPQGTRDTFLIDITAIPKLLHSDENW